MKTTNNVKPITLSTVMVNDVATQILSTQKVVTNLMNQMQIVIDKNTPLCCDPSMETYWSM
jgi:hypothetical protein